MLCLYVGVVDRNHSRSAASRPSLGLETMEDFARIVLRSPKGGGGGGGKGGGGSKGGKSKGSSGSSSSRPGGGVYVGGGGGVGPQPLWLVIVFSIIAFFIVLFLSILIFLALRGTQSSWRESGHPASSYMAQQLTFHSL